MRVLAIVHANAASEEGDTPETEMLEAMGRFNEELVAAGVLLAAEGLRPSREGKRVLFSGTDRTVVDGPFTETKELVAGFWLWQVKTFDEAVEWAKRCPNPHNGDSSIELRRVFEAEDFGDALTPELAEREATLRTRAAATAQG